MAKYRILVIDDTRVIRLSLKSLFEKIGAEVLELGNADDLFQSSWRFHNLDLIFLDIDLPGMNGMTALVKIKEDPKWTDVPIIMLTSNADPALVRKAIQNGIVDYVRKPFIAETLLRRVTSILNHPDELAIEDSFIASPADCGSECIATTSFQAILEIDPAENIPEGFSPLLKPPISNGIEINSTLTLVIPFQFAGTLAAATTEILQHLKNNRFPIEKCKVTIV